jgi:hypothetical protein
MFRHPFISSPCRDSVIQCSPRSWTLPVEFHHVEWNQLGISPLLVAAFLPNFRQEASRFTKASRDGSLSQRRRCPWQCSHPLGWVNLRRVYEEESIGAGVREVTSSVILQSAEFSVCSRVPARHSSGVHTLPLPGFDNIAHQDPTRGNLRITKSMLPSRFPMMCTLLCRESIKSTDFQMAGMGCPNRFPTLKGTGASLLPQGGHALTG